MNIPEDIQPYLIVNGHTQGLSKSEEKINEILAYLREKEKTSRATAHHLKHISSTLTPADVINAEEQYGLRRRLYDIGRQ